MKRLSLILMLLLLVVGGCKQGNQSDNESDLLITVDVKNSFPSKELVLQDFMEVEYIALETSDEFLCQGKILDMGDDFILVRNESSDGNIFLYDRNGKGIRKINRYGQGGEEYTYIYGAVLDEDNEEIFVNNIMVKNVKVYDLEGNFKRSFEHKEGVITDNMYDFDKEKLFCEISIKSEKPDQSTFALISKQDGSIIDKAEIHYKEKKSTAISGDGGFLSLYPYKPIMPFRTSWILTEASSDTVFSLSPDQSMMPFLVRTPSIQSMNPEVFLLPKIFTDRYYFMEMVKKENDFTKTDLMYDRQEKGIYKYTLCNGDYTEKQPINMVTCEFLSDGTGFWQKIEAYDLLQSYEKGKLKGKLKEVAAGLEEGSNPVIMLVKNKRQ